MKKARLELENKLLKVFDYCARDKKITHSFQQKMNKHNYSCGSTNSIIMKMNHISTISDEELLWFTHSSLEICKEYRIFSLVHDLKIEDYFTQIEIQNWINSKIERRGDSVYPVTFENVVQISSDQFSVVLDARTIYSLYRNQLVNYNKNTQRQMSSKTVNGECVYTISVYKQKVKEIKEELEKGLFIPDTLFFNVSLDNPENDFDYDDNTFILKSGNTDIIDGYHRFRAITDLASQNPEFNSKFPVIITTFTEDKARRFIVQKDKQTPMKKSYIKSLSADRFIKLIIEKLNGDSDSALYGKLVPYNNNGIDYEAIVNTINEAYDSIESRATAINISNDLKEYFNDFIDSGNDLDFKDSVLIILCCKLGISLDKIKNIEFEEKRFKAKTVTKSLIKYCIKKLMEE